MRLKEFKESEAIRKAEWFAKNKKKKNETQKAYRQSKREQMLMDLTKGDLNE